MKLKFSVILTIIISTFNPTFAQDKNPGKEPFKSNLPIIILEVDGQINAQDKIAAHMKVLYKEGQKQYASDAKDYSFDGNIRIKLRGNSSLGYSQKKFTLETRDAEDKELDVPLLGMPAEHDWVLLSPYADVSMIRDALAFRLWTDMGYWAPRIRMCEVVYNGEYAGIYGLAESIKPGKDRVDIGKLKKKDVSGRELTGGYLLRIDTYNEKDATFTSDVPGIGEGGFTNQITWTCRYPKKKKLQPEQFDYIKGFIHDMEHCIASDSYADPKEGYSKYINVSSFIDYFIHTELSLNPDGYKRSAYFYKTKQNEDGTGGKLHAGPTWDYNLAYGMCSFCNADDINAWVFEGCNTNPTPQIWKKLYLDPAFLKKVKARYAELRKTTLSEKHINGIIDEYVKELSKVQKRHFDRYPELLGEETKRNEPGTGMFGNFGGFAGGFPGMGEMPEGGFPGFGGGMPGFGGAMPDSVNFGGFPGFGGGFPGFGGGMPDMSQIPNFGGRFPGFGGGGFPGMPEGGFPGFGGAMPDSISFGGFPGFGGGFPAMPEGGFPGFGGGMPDMGQMGGFPGMGDMGGMMLSMFRSYSVKNYEDEIKMLKQWLSERLKVLDEKLDYHS